MGDLTVSFMLTYVDVLCARTFVLPYNKTESTYRLLRVSVTPFSYSNCTSPKEVANSDLKLSNERSKKWKKNHKKYIIYDVL